MKMLIFFLEGSDDKRFFETIISPLIINDFDCIQCYEYASKSKKVVKNFLSAIIRLNYKYLFVKDFDRATCFSQIKDKVVEKFSNCDKNNIQIVQREIESWYAAGISAECGKKLGINMVENCNEITKELFFNQLSKHRVRQDAMVEILKDFKIDLAKSRNTSLNYLIENKLKVI